LQTNGLKLAKILTIWSQIGMSCNYMQQSYCYQ